MSVVEKLEKAIKNHPDYKALPNMAFAKKAMESFGKIEREFVAFKKACVIVPRNDDELLEKLAQLEHKQWNHWMLYQEKKFGHVTDMTIDEWYKQQELWQRWIRLANTPYVKLTEKEKKSDREWARKVLKLLGVEKTK